MPWRPSISAISQFSMKILFLAQVRLERLRCCRRCRFSRAHRSPHRGSGSPGEQAGERLHQPRVALLSDEFSARICSAISRRAVERKLGNLEQNRDGAIGRNMRQGIDFDAGVETGGDLVSESQVQQGGGLLRLDARERILGRAGVFAVVVERHLREPGLYARADGLRRTPSSARRSTRRTAGAIARRPSFVNAVLRRIAREPAARGLAGQEGEPSWSGWRSRPAIRSSSCGVGSNGSASRRRARCSKPTTGQKPMHLLAFRGKGGRELLAEPADRRGCRGRAEPALAARPRRAHGQAAAHRAFRARRLLRPGRGRAARGDPAAAAPRRAVLDVAAAPGRQGARAPRRRDRGRARRRGRLALSRLATLAGNHRRLGVRVARSSPRRRRAALRRSVSIASSSTIRAPAPARCASIRSSSGGSSESELARLASAGARAHAAAVRRSPRSPGGRARRDLLLARAGRERRGGAIDSSRAPRTSPPDDRRHVALPESDRSAKGYGDLSLDLPRRRPRRIHCPALRARRNSAEPCIDRPRQLPYLRHRHRFRSTKPI